jgi:hypothetical protein
MQQGLVGACLLRRHVLWAYPCEYFSYEREVLGIPSQLLCSRRQALPAVRAGHLVQIELGLLECDLLKAVA